MTREIKGFTLVEILLVLVLMGAVFGLSMPYFFGISKMESVASAADNFAQKIKGVQTDALSNEQKSAPAGRKALGHFLAVNGAGVTSFDLGIFRDDGVWQITNTLSLAGNLVVDANSSNKTIYFKAVSGQTRASSLFHSGSEPAPLTANALFYFHYLGENAPCYQVQVEPSGRVWIQSIATCP